MLFSPLLRVIFLLCLANKHGETDLAAAVCRYVMDSYEKHYHCSIVASLNTAEIKIGWGNVFRAPAIRLGAQTSVVSLILLFSSY